MCFFSSIQNFFVNIFYYGNSVKILRQAFGNYEVNNKAGVGIKLEGLEKLKKINNRGNDYSELKSI